MKSISFIIPTYNASIHIETCLQSIRKQKYPQEKVEILILDGDSSDNTLSIVKKYGYEMFPVKGSAHGIQVI